MADNLTRKLMENLAHKSGFNMPLPHSEQGFAQRATISLEEEALLLRAMAGGSVKQAAQKRPATLMSLDDLAKER